MCVCVCGGGGGVTDRVFSGKPFDICSDVCSM